MDNKNLKIGGLIAAIVVALAIVGVFAAKNASDGQGARTPDQAAVLDAIDKVGGDPNKLDPAMKAKFDQMNANNKFSSVDHYGQPGSKPPAGAGGSGAPAGYPTPGGTSSAPRPSAP